MFPPPWPSEPEDTDFTMPTPGAYHVVPENERCTSCETPATWTVSENFTCWSTASASNAPAGTVTCSTSFAVKSRAMLPVVVALVSPTSCVPAMSKDCDHASPGCGFAGIVTPVTLVVSKLAVDPDVDKLAESPPPNCSATSPSAVHDHRTSFVRSGKADETVKPSDPT